METTTSKVRVLIFTLGSLQVFCWQTPEEHLTSAPYKDVYWQDAHGGNVYGPFVNIYETMKHYTWLVDNQKGDVETKTGQVIHVNFFTKRRVNYA